MNYHLITKQSGNTKKNRIVEVKYYEIFKNDNKKINRKIHGSQIFSNLIIVNEKNYLYN